MVVVVAKKEKFVNIYDVCLKSAHAKRLLPCRRVHAYRTGPSAYCLYLAASPVSSPEAVDGYGKFTGSQRQNGKHTHKQINKRVTGQLLLWHSNFRHVQ